MAAIPKVDVHHHAIPAQFAGVDLGVKGVSFSEWTLPKDNAFSESIGVRTSIFSVPFPITTGNPKECAVIARSLNEYCASLRDSDPQKYGFFATIPSLEHTELVIQELQYAFDTLHADGVILFTRYGTEDGYLGNQEYVPVWEELNARKAVVFVHPVNNKNGVLFNAKLPMPAFDWPHETGRTAMDLILNKRLQQFPDVKIILSHGGGTLPALVERSTMIEEPQFGAGMSAEDIRTQAKSFYFDLALCGSNEMLPLVLRFAKRGHVLFGSDYPPAPDPMSYRFTKFIDEYEMDDDMREEIYHGTAEKIFPRLKGAYSS